ncbi:23S rRNA pseudouridine955/2504/2580 synthase [Allopseudospirillum japonicum]|uniref:Pseudouridine synthase n=1 Tax=Allopseudospirillum japonicum TaxID=64971 RepID=A0A1H6S805_9GAMM|nr:RluA family pseudouridine synthase [Allopseudospirillum japonicum]SEI60897.1 23S rRNA pseudouridine955/2504/2580 synthase [Allopseudospirillum japonicum]
MSTQVQSQVQWLTVNAHAQGQRLDNFLRTQLKGVPKTLIYRIIRKGEVRVNKKRIKADYRLQVGDEIRIPPVRLAASAAQVPVSKNLKQRLQASVLYESAACLVLNKPAGLAVHGGTGVHQGVIEALRQTRPELEFLELVHRLDKGTSGCLLLAKSRPALLALQTELKAKQMRKGYHAIVQGIWPAAYQQVEYPLSKSTLGAKEAQVRVDEAGKSALTLFKPLQQGNTWSLVHAEPITGRTHQIRVHAQAMGHPLLGDLKYGDSHWNTKYKHLGWGRLFLHAYQLSFTDPSTQSVQNIQAPYDQAWRSLLEHLNAEGA